MRRFLSVVEHTIPEDRKGAFEAEVKNRRDAANVASLKYWIFAHSTDASRFVEFVEGSDPTLVAATAGVNSDTLWCTMEGL